ncbi:hypothetical protein GUJ93_ZPchr0003g16734 [Zizania palustris]|uniref:WW domain-containing protein n=1 Tax=Zizania palustris TaxID=103762 RepID=A0A8J5SDJ8_ZIZPA|nr:hypothetical protein GUJ93_ZPchr0003g16734 [Zizania palustris]
MPGEAEDLPAIRKLGRHFRLTEVHLWDDWYVAGANASHRTWRSVETGSDGCQMDKSENKPAKQTDEDNSFVEDLELASLMGSLGLPVSFSTSKEKKNTPNKVKKNGRKVLYEATNTLISDAASSCTGTKEIESVVQLMDCVEQTDPCSSFRNTLGYSEVCRDNTEKMFDKDSVYANKQEESGCDNICSATVVPSNKAENNCEHETYQFHANMSNPVSPVQENQFADNALQLNKVMLGRNSVDNESRISSAEICQKERLLTSKDQLLGETLSTSHDNNDGDHETRLSSPEPSPVDDNHAQKFESGFCLEYGDWRVLWDPFYTRYYFYNILTQESTWYPPHGLEDFVSHSSTCVPDGLDDLGSQYKSMPVQEHSKSPENCDPSSGVLCSTDNTLDDYMSEVDQQVVQSQCLSTCNSEKEILDQAGGDKHLDGQGQDCYSELSNLSDILDEETKNRCIVTIIDEAHHTENIQNDSSMSEALEMNQEVAHTKKKKRARKSQSYHSCQDLEEGISSDIAKYWAQRYSLFSLFDSGIKMDEEGWFSVTPELIAKHHASRVGTGVMIDCFTGVGGNAIHFATKCKHVIAIDIDPQKIDCAQHNATVYGVNDHIDFITGDFIPMAPHLKGETAFMSPPWGGPDYAKVDVYDIKAMLKPCDGYSLFKLATSMASTVVMFLPRNIDQNQLADMCLSVDPPWAVEVEKNFLNGKLKAITAYFEEQDGSGVQYASDTNPQSPECHVR